MGDTIEIDGQIIRLYGIDAPEKEQLCQVGKWSQLAMRIMRQQCLAGEIDGIHRMPVQGHNPYDRVVAVCFDGKEDLNDWMVRNGWVCCLSILLNGLRIGRE